MPKISISQTAAKKEKNFAGFMINKIKKAASETIFQLPDWELNLMEPIEIFDKTISIIGNQTKLWSHHNEPAISVKRKDVGSIAFLSDFSIQNVHGQTSENHGVVINVPTQMNNVIISNFSGNGIHMQGNNEKGTDVSFSKISNVKVENCRGDGIYIQGADANQSLFYGIDVRDNDGWGINDESFLGNQYYGCMAHTNGQPTYYDSDKTKWKGHYRVADANASSTFTNCYGEQDSRPSIVNGSTIIIGGFHANGMIVQNLSTFIRGRRVSNMVFGNISFDELKGMRFGKGSNTWGHDLTLIPTEGHPHYRMNSGWDFWHGYTDTKDNKLSCKYLNIAK